MVLIEYNTRILCNNHEESKKVQELLFSKGYKWNGCDKPIYYKPNADRHIISIISGKRLQYTIEDLYFHNYKASDIIQPKIEIWF